MSLSPTIKETTNKGLKRGYDISIKAEAVQKEIANRIQQAAASMTAPGFRKGKVPLSLAKKRHGDAIRGEVLEKLVSGAVQEAFKKHEVTPALQPNIDVDKDYTEDKDLTFTVAVETFPKVPALDISKIELTRAVVKLTDKEVTEGIDRVLNSRKIWEPITGKRAAKKGDTVVIDFEGSVDGELFDGGTASDFRLELGSGQFIPGFEDQVVGTKKDGEVLVKVTFPENYGAKNLAGKDAEFKVTVHDILEGSKPELTEELAKELGTESVDDFKAKVTAQLEGDFEQISRFDLKKALFDKLDKDYSFDIPEGMVSLEEEALKKQTEQSGEEAPTDKELKKLANRRIRVGMLLAELGRKEKLTISENELRDAVFAQARQFPGQEQNVIQFFQKNPQALDELKGPILEEKVVDFVLKNAKIKDKSLASDKMRKLVEED